MSEADGAAPPAGPRRAAALAVGKAAHEVLALGDVPLAQRLATLALETDDGAANLHSVMAGVLEAQGRFGEALPHWRRAVGCAPASAGQRFNLALALLRAGELVEGLALHEARYDKQSWSSLAAKGSLDGLLHRIPRPGDVLTGRRVLVLTEQGLGDSLWAARWLPALAASGARLTLATRPALRPLLEGLAAFEAVLGPPDEAPGAKVNLAALAGRFDAFVPMMSLPWLLGVTAPGAAGVPWLRPDAREAAAWRGRYAQWLPGRRRIVGLVWQANPESQSGAARSVPTAALAPLAELDQVGFVALQGGPGHGKASLQWLVDGLRDGELPLPSLAAAIAATDLLLCVDTMAMHLAGAMGHPALVLGACSAPGFVLGPEEERCAWYPSLRLVRQRPSEPWTATVLRAREILKA